MPFRLNDCSVCNIYTVGLLKKVLKNAKHLENFIDDVNAHSDGFENQLKTLRDLFERVKCTNLKIKPSKTRICYTEVEFLGHTISSGSIRPMQTNVEKLISAPTPKTKKGVRSLLGAVGFLQKFIPNCAEILKPLTQILLVKISPTRLCGRLNIRMQLTR